MTVAAKLVLFGVVLVGSTATGRPVLSQVGSQCNAIEEEEGNDAYNRQVCSGVYAMAAGHYDDAIRSFEDALEMHLFEYPNFALLPRLALAYWNAGRAEEALIALEKAELSLRVLVGIYRCHERADDSHWILITSSGGPVLGEYVEETTRRMCGAAYADMYEFDESRPWKSFEANGRLVAHFLNIKMIIRGK